MVSNRRTYPEARRHRVVDPLHARTPDANEGDRSADRVQQRALVSDIEKLAEHREDDPVAHTTEARHARAEDLEIYSEDQRGHPTMRASIEMKLSESCDERVTRPAQKNARIRTQTIIATRLDSVDER